MPIDINARRAELAAETQAKLAEKHAADIAKHSNWVPLFSRIKIERAKETLSGTIQAIDQALYVRGKIVAVGPDVGKRDGKTVHDLKPGMFIIYQRAHEIVYTDVHGKEHIFLKDQADVQSLIAIEDTAE
jgi:co-chaperonin GroES (HSP10)